MNSTKKDEQMYVVLDMSHVFMNNHECINTMNVELYMCLWQNLCNNMNV